MKKTIMLLTLVASSVYAVESVKSKWAQLPEEKKKEIIFIVRHNPQKTLELQESDKDFKEMINTFEFYQAILRDQLKEQAEQKQESAAKTSPNKQLT